MIPHEAPHHLPLNPFAGLSFSEALKIGPLLDRLCEAAQFHFEHTVGSQLPADMAAAAKGMRIVARQGKLEVAFSKAGQQLLKAGHSRLMRSTSGELIPLVISRGGKAALGSKAALAVSQLSMAMARSFVMVVSLAHLVVGNHLSKRMEGTADSIDILVEARRIAHLSRLEGIYRYAREMLSADLGAVEQHEIYALCKELFELRAEWRRTLDQRLDEVEREKHTGLWKLWFPKGRRIRREAENANVISTGEVEIHLMDFSLMLHLCLAHAVGRGTLFLEHSLGDELDEMDRVYKELQEKSTLIHADSDAHEIVLEPVLKRFDEMIRRYRFFTEPLPVLEMEETRRMQSLGYLTDVAGNDTSETSTV